MTFGISKPRLATSEAIINEFGSAEIEIKDLKIEIIFNF